MAPSTFNLVSNPDSPIDPDADVTEVTQCKNRQEIVVYLVLAEQSRTELRTLVLLPPVVIILNEYHAGLHSIKSKDEVAEMKAERPSKKSGEKANARPASKLGRSLITGALKKLIQLDEDGNASIEEFAGSGFQEALAQYGRWSRKDDYVAAFLHHAAALLDQYDLYIKLRDRKTTDNSLDQSELDKYEELAEKFNDPAIYATLSNNHENDEIPEDLQFKHAVLPTTLHSIGHLSPGSKESKFELYNRIWQLIWTFRDNIVAPSKWATFFKNEKNIAVWGTDKPKWCDSSVGTGVGIGSKAAEELAEDAAETYAREESTEESNDGSEDESDGDSEDESEHDSEEDGLA